MSEELKLEDTNMANYGSEAHRKAAQMAAATEGEYEGAGSAPGLEIWRVENRRSENDTPLFGIKRWPQEDYGEFYEGDSYILLNTYKKTDPASGEETDALAWDLHFWLGKETSIDERGVAAYKSVELDDLLSDGPIQHRETMENESPLFQSYFKNGIHYLKGGIESGFRHVAPEEYAPRLLELRRAKKVTRARQVPTSVASMNKSDCYILDLGAKIYKYFGENSSPFEKSHTGTVALNIVTSRNGRSEEVEIDADEDFWQTLGGTEADVRESTEDDEAKKQIDPEVDFASVKLLRISDEDGKITFTDVEKNDGADGFSVDQLDPSDVFVVDSGVEIFIWVGSGSSKKEKSMSWKLVDDYMEENSRPNHITVSVIKEGQMNSVFSSCFV